MLLSVVVISPCLGIEAWTPQTGEVNLEERPRDDAEAHFRHAAALFAAGEAKSAAQQLKGLLEQHPEAEWAEQAHYLLGLARYNRGRYRAAFRAWHPIHEKFPESDQRKKVFALQRTAAKRQTQKSLRKGLKMFDQLTEIAPDRESGALAQKDRADALLAAGEYLRASDQYLALVDYYPDSSWVPYAWYRMGKCHLELAKWIGRGTEHLEEARRRLEDFLANFPEHQFADEAEAELNEVQTLMSGKYRDIAEYYLGPGKRPTAALPYLRHIQRSVPESSNGEWAERKINEILEHREAPAQGHVRTMALPGVSQKRETEDKGQ